MSAFEHQDVGHGGQPEDQILLPDPVAVAPAFLGGLAPSLDSGDVAAIRYLEHEGALRTLAPHFVALTTPRVDQEEPGFGRRDFLGLLLDEGLGLFLHDRERVGRPSLAVFTALPTRFTQVDDSRISGAPPRHGP